MEGKVGWNYVDEKHSNLDDETPTIIIPNAVIFYELIPSEHVNETGGQSNPLKVPM